MSKDKNTVRVGFPLASILTIIFVIAKLAGHFAYSWWIVFLPVIISTGAVLTFLALAVFMAIIVALLD